MLHFRSRRGDGVAGLMALAGAALVSGSALAEPPEGAAPLKGPRVTENRAPGAEGNFGAGVENRKPGLEPRLDLRAFREAMRETIGADAPEALRATPEQHEEVEGIVRSYMRGVREHMEAHRDELAALRAQAGIEGGERGARKGGKGKAEKGRGEPSGDAPASAEMQGARQRLKEIMQGAPKPAGMMNQVWQVLSPAQRAAVEARMGTIKRDHTKERDERMFKDKLRERRGSGDEAGGGSEPGRQRKVRKGAGEQPGGE